MEMFQPHVMPLHRVHDAVKVRDDIQTLHGDALDAAVADVIGGGPVPNFQPSRKWSHGGPLLEHYRINVAAAWTFIPGIGDHPTGEWQAFRKMRKEGDPFVVCRGPTALVAAMRVLVATGWGPDDFGAAAEDE